MDGRWLNPWRAERWTLVTRLSAAECGALLERRLAPWDTVEPRGDRPLRGGVTADGFVVAPPGRGSWQLEAVGTFAPLGTGTRVVVYLRQSRPTTVVETLVLGAITVYLTAALMLGPAGPDWRHGVAALVVGAALHVLGHADSDVEAARLLHFLRETLDAWDAGNG
jgi:hypothetical protein